MKSREFLQRLSAAALLLPGLVAADAVSLQPGAAAQSDSGVRDLLQRSRRPDQHYSSDVHLDSAQLPTLNVLHRRLERLQRIVGHGNFALIGVDEMRAYGRNYSKIGSFSKEEETLLEQLFYTDASSYGFYGNKPLARITDRIERRTLKRQSGSSQYLYRGEAEAAYAKIKQALGDEVILTSGVRGVVKQLHLFVSKAVAFEGNLSLASRSLAPPGYSFHGIGDFDVGKRGWGARNFTSDFAATELFSRLQELGFITMRYPRDNQLGVRYEPWHIKVISA
jgi:hypothetical protein